MYKNIEAERKRIGMSLEELTNKIGVSRKTYFNWMNKGNIPASKLIELSSIMDCSVDYLLGLIEINKRATLSDNLSISH